MSLAALSVLIASAPGTVISTDLFNTVLLRDHTTETRRLAAAGRRAARRLGLDPAVVVELRWTCHDSAYRAVGIERPHGDASLRGICSTMATALGLDGAAAGVLADAEVEVDVEHLRPNRRLVDLLDGARARGVRVIAVSDTYYSTDDLTRILDAVVGHLPVDAVYSSADLGSTKHAGGIFDLVAAAEGVDPSAIVHIGDDLLADVTRARAALWTPTHLPRGTAYRATALVGRLVSVPARLRRDR
ncbi:HAD family hydrolase [Geodermatophilus sp. DSM 45219]|uniref:HAD family hydrolase n=1 Tax=Geodermatophilus sp. DSM 45219 TaxID=1881103 RepID=UPI000885C0DF|nr:HAD family hydrolase [Geodermatophilus sp. DSM 45219]SDN55434.1 hypothetical protein SAMN05428965_0910 [Geodermatophilus sp. DSM 45219]